MLQTISYYRFKFMMLFYMTGILSKVQGNGRRQNISRGANAHLGLLFYVICPVGAKATAPFTLMKGPAFDFGPCLGV